MTQPPGPAAQPSNNLVLAILVTLFCCLPFGIVAIVKSSQVNGLWAQGQYAAAQQSAAAAKKWALVGAAVGIASFVLYGILIAAGVINMDFETETTY